MKASRIHRFGAPDVIVLEDIPVPGPGAREVLVRVHAAGVGPWDGWVRSGKSVLPQPLPLTLGSDLSGTVEAVGAEVTELGRGDAIFGVTNPRFTGACAEYAIASASMIAKKPRGLSHVEAASIPVVAVTAWQMLFDHAQVVAGQNVLVHGGAGNVGAYAVQLARRAGARVIATGLPDQLDLMRDLGADVTIDVLSARFEDLAGPVDAIIDTIGGTTFKRSIGLLARGGTLVSSVSKPDAEDVEQVGRLGAAAEFMLVDVTSARLAQIAELFESKALRPRIGSVMPLAEIRAAHEMLDGLRARPSGKIVLDVSSA